MPRLPYTPKLGGLPKLQSMPKIAAPKLPAGGQRWPPPPEWWKDGRAEWLMFWAHGPAGRGDHGILWFFHTPPFGSVGVTGFVPDFLEVDIRICYDVFDPSKISFSQAKARKVLRETIMRSFDYTYLTVDVSAAYRNPIASLQTLLTGQDVTAL